MEIKGIAASGGISIAKIYKLESIVLDVKKDLITDVEKELDKLKESIEISKSEIQEIREQTAKTSDEEHAMIFDAHIQIIEDPEMSRQVHDLISDNNYNAAYAFQTVSETFAQIFESMDNEYMKERASDVRDISKRVISHLLNVKMSNPSSIDEEVIVVARDLTPSDTAQLNRKYVKGFITNIGGRTSHSAIMARSLEIPAVVGTKNVLELVKNNELMVLDGLNGLAIINPSNEQILKYEKLQIELLEKKKIWARLKNSSTVTKDFYKVEIAANIGSPEDIENVIKNGAEGIGLYRTEFLYMNNNDFPTEDEQLIAYKMVLEAFPKNKVVIRTLDIGGDKELSYLKMDLEMNPFLGRRALRLCLANIELFKTQLRALLRASIYGNLHIMFPMVATLGELRDAKKILKECHSELNKEGFEVSGNYKVGIMVEIPAVAILADQFAKEVDFFSIGTNDLIQYTFAADRMNEKVSYLYQPYNPSLLRLIKMVIDASHKEGIWTGMCGEMAGDQIAAPILLGMGLDEFSMSATSILQTRHLFSQLNYQEMKSIITSIINLKTNEEVNNYMSNLMSKIKKY